METTKNSNSAPNKDANATERIFTNASNTLLDAYKKQMDLTAGFYNNLLNLGSSQNLGFSNPFSNMDISKWFSNPMLNFSTSNFQNPFLPQIEKSMNQIKEFNDAILSTLTNGFQGKTINWGEMTDGYKETLEARVEASKKILGTLSETMNKQMDTSIETNKKTVEELNNQMELVMKQNQKFWTEVMKTFQSSADEAKNSEFSSNNVKKRANVTVS